MNKEAVEKLLLTKEHRHKIIDTLTLGDSAIDALYQCQERGTGEDREKP